MNKRYVALTKQPVKIKHNDPAHSETFEGHPGIIAGREAMIVDLPDLPNGHGAGMWIGEKFYHGVLWMDRLNPETQSVGFDIDIFPEDAVKSAHDMTHPLVVQGDFFFDAVTGERVVIALNSDFKLFKMWLDGDRTGVDTVIAQRLEAGSRGVRVFGTCGYLFDFDPWDYGETYYVELPLFADYLLTKTMMGEITCFTDQQMPTFDGFDRQLHWRRTNEALAGKTNILVQLVNEYLKNGIDPRQFQAIPNGCPQSPGSFSDGWDPPSMRGWQYGSFNPRRDWKWSTTIPMTIEEVRAYPNQGRCYLIDEPIGADEHPQEGRRASDPEKFEQMAVDCGVWTAGGTFHSQAGLNSQLWPPVQLECAKAFFRGINR